MIASPELIAALDADGQSFMMARSAPRENAATDGTIVFEWRLIRVGRRGVAALYAIADRETARKILPSAQLTVILYRRIDIAPGQAVEQGTPAAWWLWQIAPTPWAAVWNRDDAFSRPRAWMACTPLPWPSARPSALLTELETAHKPLHGEYHERFIAAGRAEPGPAPQVRARPGAGSRAAGQGHLRTARRRVRPGIAGTRAPRQGH